MGTMKCIIVDDELLILQRLEHVFQSIGSTYPQFQLVGMAESGEQALEMAAVLQPDIVITDIIMPRMNGLELIQILKPRMTEAEFILLSAYTDFAYARQGIELGVLAYIPKVPLNEQDVVAVLLKAEQQIEQRRRQAATVNRLNISLRSHLYQLRTQYFQEWLRGDITSRAVQAHKQELSIGVEPEGYSVCLLQLDDESGFRSAYDMKDQKALRYGMVNIMEESIHYEHAGFALELFPCCFLGMVKLHHANSGHLSDLELRGLGRRLCSNMKSHVAQSVSIAFSTAAAGWECFTDRYKEACSRMEERFYRGRGTVITPGDRRPDSHPKDRQAWHTLFAEWASRVEEGTQEDVDACMEKVRELMEPGAIPPLEVRRAVGIWHDRLSHHIGEGSAAEGAHNIQDQQFAADMAAWIEEAARRFYSRLEQRNHEATDIERAKRYILLHLNEKLTLAKLAQHLNRNPTYFSTFFHREMGESFTEYVNRLRIERAISKMQQGQFTNMEIAESVGIPDEKYFCTLFKKYTGMSPQRYKRKMRE